MSIKDIQLTQARRRRAYRLVAQTAEGTDMLTDLRMQFGQLRDPSNATEAGVMIGKRQVMDYIEDMTRLDDE